MGATAAISARPPDPSSEAGNLEAALRELATAVPAARARLESLAADAAALGAGLSSAQVLNRRLAESSATAAEMIAEVELKTREVAKANAHAAELVAEIETKNQKIRELNRALSAAIARAAELIADNELKTAELGRANARLRDAIDAKSKWVGFAAHDLRGGIGAIWNLAELLLGDRVGPAADDPLVLIRDESGRLLELLGAFLDMARIEEGRVVLELRRAELSEIARAAISFLSGTARVKAQQIVLDAPEGPVPVHADPPRIRQVIDNLLSNALKFSPAGATIVVEVKQQNGRAMCSVLDEGPGLKDEDFPKLFRGFERLSATPTGGEASHGLGLALSKHLVDLHGGRIWAKNRAKREGARFCFLI